MFNRYALVGALFMCGVPIAIAQGQDSPEMARALERAEQYYVAIGPKPQPTAKWLGEDRLAYSPAGKAPWTVLDASTGQVRQPDVDDAAVGGPGPAVAPPSLGMAYFGAATSAPANSGGWTAQAANGALIVSDPTGATRLQLPGAPNHAWAVAPTPGAATGSSSWQSAATSARSTGCPSSTTAAPSSASRTHPARKRGRRCR